MAEVCAEQRITTEQVSHETIRQTLLRLGIRWQRAKHWIQSSDPQYAQKKRRRDRLIALATERSDWLLGFQDETWWSRVARSGMASWTTVGRPLRLVEAAVPRDEAKALACHGLWLPAEEATWLRFVDGRPISALTTAFLAWCAVEAEQFAGIRTLVLIWDNASWHTSRTVRQWLRAYNQAVQRAGQSVKLVPVPLPSKAPWLNPIEAKWRHAKRAIVEPERPLTLRSGGPCLSGPGLPATRSPLALQRCRLNVH